MIFIFETKMNVKHAAKKMQREDCIELNHKCGTCLTCGINYLFYDYELEDHDKELAIKQATCDFCGLFYIISLLSVAVIYILYGVIQMLYIGYSLYSEYQAQCGCNSMYSSEISACIHGCQNVTIDTKYSVNEQINWISQAIKTKNAIIIISVVVILTYVSIKICDYVDEYYEQKVIEDGVRV